LRFASFVHWSPHLGGRTGLFESRGPHASLGNNVYMLAAPAETPAAISPRPWPRTASLFPTPASRRLYDKVKAAIAKISPLPIRYAHRYASPWRSHGGQHAFAKAGAVLVAHYNARRRMQVAGRATIALPSLTYADHMTLTLDGQTAELYHPASAPHTPIPTPSSSSPKPMCWRRGLLHHHRLSLHRCRQWRQQSTANRLPPMR